MKLNFDPRLLVQWLGTRGAIAGLERSGKFTVQCLQEISKALNIEFKRNATRAELIDIIIAEASRRIDKPVDALFEMDKDELVAYFEDRDVESPELLDLLKQLNLSPRRKESRKSLIEFAAHELSETGRFMRIARNRPHTGQAKSLQQ
ncbi:MAG: hypothetical protein B6245_21985 [Desulfobacteraceae bacterium 4572_88]|nr:MAG: hypothetical protein B6245_21985 [Desulfobacteraceae bacterium 4572_88]